MTPAEAAALLTVAAAFDNRKPDADQAKAWAMALDGLRFEDCRDAIVAHFKTSSDWLMPSEVIRRVKAIRTDRLMRFGPYHVPDDLNSREYCDYVAATNKRIADGELTDPAELEPPGLVKGDVPEMRAILRSLDDA